MPDPITIDTVAPAAEKDNSPVKQCPCGVLIHLCDTPICNACEIKENFPAGWFNNADDELANDPR